MRWMMFWVEENILICPYSISKDFTRNIDTVLHIYKLILADLKLHQ